MSQDTERLAAGFERVLGDPAPPTSVDAALLLDRGHRLLRRRRTAGAVSATALAGAAVLVATTLPGLAGHSAQPGGSASTAYVNPPRFGWLPTAPDSYTYEFYEGGSSVTARWSNEPSQLGPSLTLVTAAPNQAMPTVLPLPQQTLPSSDHPVQVGTIDGNPAWYYPYDMQFSSGGIKHDALAWKTASGYWAVLEDVLVDGPTLLHIATTADTTPTPVKVPLTTTLDLGKASSFGPLLTQTRDNSAFEYTTGGNLGDESISIIGLAGDTGAATPHGTRCDFMSISGLGSYPKLCDTAVQFPREGLSFDAPALSGGTTAPLIGSTTPSPSASLSASTVTPTTTPTGSATQPTLIGATTPPGAAFYLFPPVTDQANTSPLDGASPFEGAHKVINGVDVYVSVSVNQAFSQSQSEKVLNEITSFGTDPSGWQTLDPNQ